MMEICCGSFGACHPARIDCPKLSARCGGKEALLDSPKPAGRVGGKSKRRSAAKHLFPYWLRAQNIEIRLALSNPSNRTVPGRQEQGLGLVRRVIPDFTESP
jgi:hypothetical protein